MGVREAIAKIRDLLEQQKKSGQSVVEITAILDCLGTVEQQESLDSERRKLEHESHLAHYRALQESNLAGYLNERQIDQEIAVEMFRSVLMAAKIALTTSILVNGGATIALLSFLGSLIGKTPPPPAGMQSLLSRSLICFAVGVVAGAFATGFAYLTQFCYASDRRRWGIGFHVVTVVLTAGAYIAFLGGVVEAYRAFIK